MILGRWLFGARMNPDWLPDPPKPKPHVLERAAPTQHDQEWADIEAQMEVLLGYIWELERWARMEDHIDQMVKLSNG